MRGRGSAGSQSEHGGELQEAADHYADAAHRWHTFGNVPEHAFALLGHGRCLTALDRHAEATKALEQARTIFQKLKAAPALAQIDALLQAADALRA